MLERSFNYVSFPEFAARFWRIQVEIEIERERKSERNGGNHCPDSLSRGKLPTDRMLVANETSERRKEREEWRKKNRRRRSGCFSFPVNEFTFHAAKLTLRLPANVDYAARCRNLICYMDSMNQFH